MDHARGLISAILAALSFAAFGQAQPYPAKPVTLIVSAAPGGPNELEARIYANKMTELLAQQFLLDFKPGAGTTLGPAFVAKAAADGYTRLVATGNFTVAPSFYKNLSYNNVRDFAPLSLMSKRMSALLVHPSFPAKSFAEYLAYAKTSPGKLNFGTTGAGSITHLAGAWMHSATGTQATFVHYKGAGPQQLDLVSGRLDATAMGLLVGLPLIKAGKLRALAILNDRRSDLLPGVPTIAEQGIPGYDYPAWLGLLAPAGTPAAVVGRLSENLARVAKSPDVAAKLEAEGGVMIGSTPAQFGQLIVAETARWQKLIQELGITLAE